MSEGETAEIAVRYRVRELASAWTLRLAALPGTASAGDFELVGDGLVIPAGRGVSGEVSTPLRALADRSFAEGSETVTIRFAADPGTGADLGGDLVVVLREAGASPCPGVTVRALAPAPAADDDQLLGTDLTIERSAAGAGTILVLRGPYYWEEWLGEEFAYEPVSATRIVSWGERGRRRFDAGPAGDRVARRDPARGAGPRSRVPRRRVLRGTDGFLFSRRLRTGALAARRFPRAGGRVTFGPRCRKFDQGRGNGGSGGSRRSRAVARNIPPGSAVAVRG